MVLIIVQLHPHGDDKRFGTAHLFFQNPGAQAVFGALVSYGCVNDSQERKEDKQCQDARKEGPDSGQPGKIDLPQYDKDDGKEEHKREIF